MIGKFAWCMTLVFGTIFAVLGFTVTVTFAAMCTGHLEREKVIEYLDLSVAMVSLAGIRIGAGLTGLVAARVVVPTFLTWARDKTISMCVSGFTALVKHPSVTTILQDAVTKPMAKK